MKTKIPEQEVTNEVAKKSANPVGKKFLKKKYITSSLCLGLVAVGGIQGYSLFFTEESPVALTGTVTFGQLGTTIEGSGTASSASTQSVALASSSEILGVYVTAGDTVEEGQLLYIQDDSELDDQIEVIQEQIETYYDTISEYNSTIADYYSSIADINESIGEATVTAPFSGKVTEIMVDIDDNVTSSGKICQLTSSSSLDVVLYFSYAYEDEIYVGQSATVAIPDQMLTLPGTVSKLSKVEYITPEGTSCFGVTITVDNPGSLTTGTEVSATIGMLYPVEAGTLSDVNNKSINAPMSGAISHIYVEEYQNVAAGQKLFQLNTDSLVDQRTALQENVTDTYEKVASVQEKIADLQQDILEIQAERDDFKVYSEISGKVITVNVTEGAIPNSSQPAVMIYNMDTMQFTANIDELDFEHVYQGMPVEVSYSTSSTTQSFEGSITAISFEATNDSGVAYFPVTISVDSQGVLSSGVSLSYKISVGDADQGYLVPIDALKSYDDGACVYVEGEGAGIDDEEIPEGFYGVAVEVATSNSQYALVKEGLEEDMTLFTRYQATAPSGGDSTSQISGQGGEMDMEAMMAMRESMMAGQSGGGSDSSNRTNAGGQSGGRGG